jgi:hypothetical protein
VTVCGDGEYVIYTALAWRNKSFGTALEFVWGDDSNVFATRESSSTSERGRQPSRGSGLPSLCWLVAPGLCSTRRRVQGWLPRRLQLPAATAIRPFIHFVLFLRTGLSCPCVP